MGETSPDQICKNSMLCPVVLGDLRPPLPPTDQPRLREEAGGGVPREATAEGTAGTKGAGRGAGGPWYWHGSLFPRPALVSKKKVCPSFSGHRMGQCQGPRTSFPGEKARLCLGHAPRGQFPRSRLPGSLLPQGRGWRTPTTWKRPRSSPLPVKGSDN